MLLCLQAMTIPARSGPCERRFRWLDVARPEKGVLYYESDFGDSWAHESSGREDRADPKKKYAGWPGWKEACPDGKRTMRHLGLLRPLKVLVKKSQAQRTPSARLARRPVGSGTSILKDSMLKLRGLGNLTRPSTFSKHLTLFLSL